jgi:6-phosphogluconolactonase
VTELNDLRGAASAFAIDPATGHLTKLNTQPTHGSDPCHLTVDRAGENLLVANYTSGHVTVLPIGPDGALAPASQVVALTGSSVNPARQAGPHAHAVVLDAAGRHLFVADLGADRILVYRYQDGVLTPHDPPFVATAPGAGPRQIKLHPTLPQAYVLNELASSLSHFAYDRDAARLSERRAHSTLPAGFSGTNSCAELRIAPSGRFAYASNRGHNSLAGFAIAPDTGDLTPIGHTQTGGAIPRNFAIHPSGEWVLAANQDSGSVVLFRANPETGALTPTGAVAKVGTPVCIVFL